jgi:hypothetical protein
MKDIFFLNFFPKYRIEIKIEIIDIKANKYLNVFEDLA